MSDRGRCQNINSQSQRRCFKKIMIFSKNRFQKASFGLRGGGLNAEYCLNIHFNQWGLPKLHSCLRHLYIELFYFISFFQGSAALKRHLIRCVWNLIRWAKKD